MDLGFCYIPAEVAVEIIAYLPNKDLKNVRLVSKRFNAFGSQFLFQSMYISGQRKDREAFTAVSKHPDFSQSVREVVYDSTNITFLEEEEHVVFNKTNYTRFLLGCHEYPPGTNSKYTKAAIHRGFKSFTQHYEEQRKLAEYGEVDSTHWMQFGRLPENFDSLIMDPTRQSEILRYLPDDLVCLVAALPRMPRVKRFVISDNRYSQDVKHAQVHSCRTWSGIPQELTLTIKHKGIRGIDEVIIDPRPWPSLVEEYPPTDCDRSWFRGFGVLMQAASMTNMSTLESFTVKRDCGMSGLSHAIFQMSSRELYHTKNAFSNLKEIQLKINTGFLDGMHWPETVEFGGLAQILGNITHLEKLDLRLDLVVSAEDDDAISFGELVGSHKWPNLHSITLSNMILKSDGYGFLEFFNRHRRTIRTMRLKQVLIQPTDPLAEPDKSELSPGNWSNIFISMASGELNLTNLTLQSGLSRHSRLTYFHSCDAEKVYSFLRAGGNLQWNFQPRCRHMKHPFWPSKF